MDPLLLSPFVFFQATMSLWVTSPSKHTTKHERKTAKLVIFTNGRSLKAIMVSTRAIKRSTHNSLLKNCMVIAYGEFI
ncbi:hypothetical protein POPTR_017G106601v4 [Populus trichocarpa]|jgi:hypothetical protein|uniref:Uncharacterized protein n=1 Tax=Populus trichocarpa TaxID=3694 RepID=A0ACC0RRU1_POPTR|nr:hypothetical protein BDE02_17G088000 [Populus trichocarpa]KAI9379515.1 hypothetical protein POPTR_017G106601v4 [Populus trichocarpa]